MPDASDSFFSKVTPGNWLTFGAVVISAIASWQWMSFQLQDQQNKTAELRASVSEIVRKIEDSGRNAADGIRLVNDSLSRRIDLLGDRTNQTSNEMSTVKADLQNLKDTVTELRRQASWTRSRLGGADAAITGTPR